VLAPIVPLALQRIVQRCLEKNPEQRFQSAHDLAFALEALSDSGSSSAMGPFQAIRLWGRRKWSTWVVSAPGDATRSSAVFRPRSRSRSIKPTAAAVGVVVVLAALVGAWTVIHRSRAMAERKAAITDIEHLIDIGRFVDVWRMAQPALRRWPNDKR